jgi:hypothetical protein
MSEVSGLMARPESQAPDWERVKRRSEAEAATARCSACVAGMVVER